MQKFEIVKTQKLGIVQIQKLKHKNEKANCRREKWKLLKNKN